MNGEPIIELSDVAVTSRRNAETVSIEALNWTVRKNEFWVVGGLQSQAQSDLMLLLAGLQSPAEGSYKLFGRDMSRHFGDEFLPSRLRIGMVFEDARLFNHLTIAENIALPARYHNNLLAEEAEAWVSALIQVTQLGELAGQAPGTLARNWRRRAALARALALKPEVLILDNPLRGLNTRHAAWWIDFLPRLWRGHDLMRGESMTVVLTTDEFRPWREAGAQFAEVDTRKFVVIGDRAPEDDPRLPRVAVEEGN